MDDIETTENNALVRAQKERAVQREREVADFKRLMSEPYGRRVVWRLMQRVFHDCSSSDPYEMAKFLGERRQGLMLLKEVLEISPEKWADMVRESKTLQ